MKPLCATFLRPELTALEMLGAPFHLFLLLPSQTLAWLPALQTVSQSSACLAPSSLAPVCWAGSLPITPSWFHSLEAGLAPDAPPGPAATSGILVTFILQCIKVPHVGISHCGFCMFMLLPGSIAACLFPFNIHSCVIHCCYLPAQGALRSSSHMVWRPPASAPQGGEGFVRHMSQLQPGPPGEGQSCSSSTSCSWPQNAPIPSTLITNAGLTVCC